MTSDGSNLIFIIGHYKSGSTWLLNMLSLHPDVRGVHETHIFHHATHGADLRESTRILFSTVPWGAGGLRNLPAYRLRQWSQPILGRWRSGLALPATDRPATLLDLSVPEQLGLRAQLLRSASPDDYCRRFFGFLCERLRPRRCLLEKTPNNIVYVDLIRRIFPRCKLIAIHRDGRDVVVSDRFFRQEYQRSADWSFEKAVLVWLQAMHAQRDAASRYEIATLSYEQLLKDGQRALTRLLGALDLEAPREVAEDLLRRSSFRFHTGRERGQENRRSFNRKGIAGDWRNHFTEQQRETFKRLAGDMLVELGYERNGNW